MSTRSYQPGDAYGLVMTIKDGTGALANADATPTGTVYRNRVVDGAVAVTVTTPATGVVAASFTIPASYALGDDVELLLRATVGGVATGEVVDRLRLQPSPVSESGTAQAGGASTITLRNGASTAADSYKGLAIYIASGTGSGVGSLRAVAGYDATVPTAPVASVDRPWLVPPDNTSTYVILRLPAIPVNSALQPTAASVAGGVGSVVGDVGGNLNGDVVGDVTGRLLGGGTTPIADIGAYVDTKAIFGKMDDFTGAAQAGSATSITLAADTPWAHLVGWTVTLADGQVARVTAYNATTKVATTWCYTGAAGAWEANPAAGTDYNLDSPYSADVWALNGAQWLAQVVGNFQAFFANGGVATTHKVDDVGASAFPGAAPANWLGSGAIAAAELAAIAGAILDLADGVEAGLTPRQALRRMRAAFGKATVTDNGDGTKTTRFFRPDGTTVALSVTNDNAGNRPTVADGTLT